MHSAGSPYYSVHLLYLPDMYCTLGATLKFNARAMDLTCDASSSVRFRG
ncbi:hypothetical protein [uncultured Campylobacter sp.]|nr:hypothetical protein [uncultured Campylobacter sp.]